MSLLRRNAASSTVMIHDGVSREKDPKGRCGRSVGCTTPFVQALCRTRKSVDWLCLLKQSSASYRPNHMGKRGDLHSCSSHPLSSPWPTPLRHLDDVVSHFAGDLQECQILDDHIDGTRTGRLLDLFLTRILTRV